jgi:hypothetical protein
LGGQTEEMLEYRAQKEAERKESDLKLRENNKRKELYRKKIHDEALAEMKLEFQ